MHRSRREFLGALLAGALAGRAGAQITGLTRRGPEQRVIVLGGGLAGLCAAYELRNQGHRVTVLEAQSHPGGRVRTLRDFYAPGLYTEAGAESIPGVHDLTIHYADSMGLKRVPFGNAGTRGIYHLRGKRIAAGSAAVWPFELTADERALGMSGLNAKYIAATANRIMASGFLNDPIAAMLPYDGMLPGAWLRSLGASAGAAELLTLGFGANFGSAASYLLHGLSFLGGKPATRIEGGNDRLPKALAEKVEVRYGMPVVSVTQSEGAVSVVTTRETLTADRVVCTLPCPAIGGIFGQARLSEAKARAIREQFYSRTVKVFLQSKTRFWLKTGLSGGATTDLPIERLTPDPGSDPAARGALTAYPIAGYTAELERMSEGQRVEAAFGQAKQIFPEMDEQFEGGQSKAWGLDPWQKGSFALHSPNQIGFIRVLGEQEGRIHFAGEHTSHWTGWMQGAFESARRVVQEINA